MWVVDVTTSLHFRREKIRKLVFMKRAPVTLTYGSYGSCPVDLFSVSERPPHDVIA